MKRLVRWSSIVVLLVLAGTTGTGMWMGGEVIRPARRSLQPHHRETLAQPEAFGMRLKPFIGITTIIVGRDEEKLRTAKEQLRENCFYKACDLSDLPAVPALIENIISEFGQVDILVNNAGINMKKIFTEVTDEDFQKVITTNLCAVFTHQQGSGKKYADEKFRRYHQHKFHGCTVRLTKSNCLQRQQNSD